MQKDPYRVPALAGLPKPQGLYDGRHEHDDHQHLDEGETGRSSDVHCGHIVTLVGHMLQ